MQNTNLQGAKAGVKKKKKSKKKQGPGPMSRKAKISKHKDKPLNA